VSNGFGVIIEGLVALLLAVTIAYCMMLNRRLRRLKGDELALKATISELITATEIAERAIAGLKLTVRECDQGLGERLRTAERFSADIDRQVDAGQAVLERLTKIVTAARPAMANPAAPAAAEAQAIAQAAQAFAARTRARVNGIAA
jgi:Domain of unknown function (DUF6468)